MGKHYRPPGKKKEGNAAKFVTRSQALKLLQISLPLFRKLCILKGVTPREPKKKFKGTHQTYYHVKDIAFLHHEPLLEVHRAIRTHERKIKKAEAKKNIERANRLREQTPKPKIDRIIQQRYPRFVDALGELDDCLSMVHLFAALPASESKKIDVECVHKCRRLAHEWQAFISRTHKLRKTFVSVKGIYYQAEVEGQTITWLTPHSLQQVVSDDVDIPTMLNFLQLYEPLLGFVNFRLYHSINLKYPPILDPQLEALAADLYALSRYVSGNTRPSAMNSEAAHLAGSEQDEAKQKGAESEDEKSKLRLAQLQHQLPSNEPGALMHLVEEAAGEDEEDQDTRECRKLFENMKFFLSREVPRESLLFTQPQWSHQETREFIAIRAELERDFTASKRNKTLWEVVSNKMRERGFRRSPEQCKCKWKNLVNRYKGKETSDPEHGKQCPFFEELHAVFTQRAHNMQRLLLESETRSTQAKKGVKRLSGDRSSEEFSEDDDEVEDDSDEERPARSNTRKRKVDKVAMEKSSRANNPSNVVGNTTSSIQEMLKEFFQHQLRMEMQWREMMERRAHERQLFEQEWRQSMEKLERERLMIEQAWREREEQRRMREESRAERRDALLTSLLNKLIHESN